VRERYGFLPAFDPGAANRCGAPAWSQRILLARRLVEAGVRLVTVDLRWWDTHVQGFDSLRRGFLPRFDRAYSALIEDLDGRGSWARPWSSPGASSAARRGSTTTPAATTTPTSSAPPWPGGPVRGGRVVGASDAKGAFPKADAKTPQDVLATMYRHLGIDTTVSYQNEAGRPLAVLPFGTPIDELC
jgi:uncharacterized protein (DUF1501 family)